MLKSYGLNNVPELPREADPTQQGRPDQEKQHDHRAGRASATGREPYVIFCLQEKIAEYEREIEALRAKILELRGNI